MNTGFSRVLGREIKMNIKIFIVFIGLLMAVVVERKSSSHKFVHILKLCEVTTAF